MNRLFAVAVIFASGMIFELYLRGGSPTALAGAADGDGGGAPTCSSKNGDVNGNGAVDLSDAVTILNFLFLGNPTQLVALCATQGTSGIPNTGQTRCYSELGDVVTCNPLPLYLPCYSGQNGAYDTGCPNDANRFTVNVNDTVTDNCTGLQWQRFAADGDGDGQKDALLWCDALAFCENLSFGGHEDWRLPNVRELESIVDYGKYNPAAAPVFRIETNQFNQYWTSTTFIHDPEQAYSVDFTIADITTGGKGSGLAVRAVRTAP